MTVAHPSHCHGARRRSSRSAFADDVLAGLRRRPKRLSPKYFYDAAGSRAVRARSPSCPNTTRPAPSSAILQRSRARDRAALSRPAPRWSSSAAARAQGAHPARRGAGSSPPTCRSTSRPSSWRRRRRALRARLPAPARCCRWRPTSPAPFALPPARPAGPRAGFFPGSTIGNFEPHEARPSCATPRACSAPGATLHRRRRPREGRGRAQRRLRRCRRRHGGVQPQPAGAHRTASWRPTSISTRFATAPSTTPSAAASRCISSACKRQTVRVLDRGFEFARGRDDPHREQLQVHGRRRSRALARQAPAGGRGGVDRRGRLFSVHALRAKGVTLQ